MSSSGKRRSSKAREETEKGGIAIVMRTCSGIHQRNKRKPGSVVGVGQIIR